MKFKINYLFLSLILLLNNCTLDTEVIESSKSISEKLSRNRISKTKKVLIVGIDGLQYERIAQLNTPNFDRLNVRKAYTGGHVGAMSEQTTYSGPGWTSILTGVWKDKHTVISNSTSSNKSKAKSIFSLVKESSQFIRTASIATWSPINSFISDEIANIDYKYDGGSDINAVNLAVNQITNQNTALTFVHLSDVDNVGHAKGFGTDYNNSILAADAQLGTLLNTVDTRINNNNEDWLVLVVTDHGRNASGGYSHGGQTTSEKTIFIAMNKQGNKEFTTRVNTPNVDFNGIYGEIAQTSIVPTVLSFLNINYSTTNAFASSPLIGNEGARKLMIHNKNLYWYSQSSSNANIYRNNQYLTSVPASNGSFNDLTAPESVVTYTVEIDGVFLKVSHNNSDLTINAALDWNDYYNTKAYFFRKDNKYVKYNKYYDKAENGYPRVTDNSSWSGLGNNANKIAAAFKANSTKAYIFLNDGTYLRYDMNADKVDNGYPKPINNSTWPGLGNYGHLISAAVKWNDQKAFIFLNNGSYFSYNLNTDKVDNGYPKPINNSTWPGLGNYATNISAVIDWRGTYVYIFLNNNTYIKYDKTNDRALSGYPKPINDSTWKGLLKI